MRKDRGARQLLSAVALCACLLCIVLWGRSPGRAVGEAESFAASSARRGRVAHSASDTASATDTASDRRAARGVTRSGPSGAVPEARRRAPSASSSHAAAATDSSTCNPEPERCDGVDNDCDGLRDEPGAAGCSNSYVDRDRDGFGAALGDCLCMPAQGLVSNGLDCDDTRSDVHPGASEVCDGQVDNDCDGYTDLCGALPHQALAPGDLAVRGVQDHMNDVDDELCEWFEIENRTPHKLELMGLEVRDDALDGFRIRRSLVLEPGSRVVLGRTGDPRTNGGVPVDYVYSDFILSNGGDSIELRSDGRVIARTAYSAREAPAPPSP